MRPIQFTCDAKMGAFEDSDENACDAAIVGRMRRHVGGNHVKILLLTEKERPADEILLSFLLSLSNEMKNKAGSAWYQRVGEIVHQTLLLATENEKDGEMQ